jgi:ABC-type ATPase involved in cell division
VLGFLGDLIGAVFGNRVALVILLVFVTVTCAVGSLVGHVWTPRSIRRVFGPIIGNLIVGTMALGAGAAVSWRYRQRVGLAAALIHDPKVLILDEPTTGLDPNQLVEIRQLIRRVGRDKTVILSTHIMQEVQAMCDVVGFIRRGQLVREASIETFGPGKEDLEAAFRAATK